MADHQIENKNIINSADKAYRSRYGFVLRSISSILVLTFLSQEFLHAQGGTPLWSHVQEAKVSIPDKQVGDRLSDIAIPYDAGLARKVVAKGQTDDVIINIQDAH